MLTAANCFVLEYYVRPSAMRIQVWRAQLSCFRDVLVLIVTADKGFHYYP